MYKQYKDTMTGEFATQAIIRTKDGACIPFDPANTDYAQFKVDLSEGAELLDADGNTMSTEQVAEFLKTLP